MLATLLAAAALLGAPRPPALCVQLTAPELDVKELTEALRARIARQEVRVIRCGSDGGGTWRLIVVPSAPGRLQLILSGPEVSADRELVVEGMSREEIAQYVALTAVEAVRPSMDALLVRLGLTVAPPADDRLLELPPAVCPEAPACPEPIPPPPREVLVAVPLPTRAAVGLVPAGVLGAQEGEASFLLEAHGAVSLGAFRLALRLGLHLMPTATVDAASVSLTELEAGASLQYRAGPVAAGLGLQNRLAIAATAGGFAGDGTQFFWNGGFGVLVDVELWRSGGFAAGVAARAWLWPQPNRFLDAGTPLLTQSYLELGVGPSISWSSDDIF